MSWSLSEIKALADAHSGWDAREQDGCLCVVDDAGLEAWVAVSGDQIVVETVLFAEDQVQDTAALNAHILRTHQLFPLTTIAVNTIDGQDYYVAFGALAAQSSADNIVAELTALFDNVTGFLDAYADYLN